MTVAPPSAPSAADDGGRPPGEPDTDRPRSIAANSTSMAIAQVLVKLLGFVSVFLLTRAVSVEAYGRYAFAFAFIAMFIPLADPGLDYHATRMVSQAPDRGPDYLGASLALKGALLPLFALCCLGVAWLTGHHGETLALVAFAVLSSAVGVLCGSYLSIFRGMRRMQHEAHLIIVTRIVAFVLTVGAIVTGRGVVAVGAVQVIAGLVGVPMVLVVASRMGLVPRWKRLVEVGRDLIVGGLPFAATGVIVMVYYRVDMLMLSQMRGEHSVGLYGAGTNVMFTLLLASHVLVSAIFPVIARHGSLDVPAARAVARRGMTLSLLMSVPFAVGGCLVSGPIMTLLFGKAYAGAGPSFMILMLTLPVLFVSGLIGNSLAAVGRMPSVMIIAGVNLVANVGLNLVLIPRMDYTGSALATLITELSGISMLVWQARKDIGALFDPRAVAGVLVANAAMGAAVWALRAWPIVPVLAAGAVVYGALAMAMRLLPLDELRALLPGARNGAAT